MLAQFSSHFGRAEEYNAAAAWFFCQEVLASYLHQPGHPVTRVVLTSVCNRLLCQLFESGAGIFQPQRVVFFNLALVRLQELRGHLESRDPSVGVQPAEASALMAGLASLFLLTCAARQRARLLVGYQAILEHRVKTFTLLQRSSDVTDQALAVKIEQDSVADPLYGSLLPLIEAIHAQQGSKRGWINSVLTSCGQLNHLVPGFTAAMETLMDPWYYKRDRSVFTFGPVLSGLIVTPSLVLPEFPSASASPMAVFTAIRIFVESDTSSESVLGGQVTEFCQRVAIALEEGVDWTAFVASTSTDIVSTTVMDEPVALLSAHQQLWLQAHQRTTELAAAMPGCSKRGREELD
jgi:hypothetical protein